MGARNGSERIYCPMCRLKRSVRRNVGAHWSMILLLLAASLILSYFMTAKIDGRVILFWIVFVIVSEVFSLVMSRMSLICQYCGFDPILYKKNKVQAMQRVKQTLEQSKASYKTQPLQKNAYASIISHLKQKRAAKTFVFNGSSGYLDKHENSGGHPDVQRKRQHPTAHP